MSWRLGGLGLCAQHRQAHVALQQRCLLPGGHANGRNDYYLASGEAPGRWMGSAAATLGLGGIVEPEDLRAVLEGIDPRSGETLVGWRTVTGFDLTLSAPKSVSLLWALGDKEVAAQVMAAHDAVVAAAVSYLEDEACVVRRGKGGTSHLGGAGFVSAAFRHRTSREFEPNLHTHLVTANMTRARTGSGARCTARSCTGTVELLGSCTRRCFATRSSIASGFSFQPVKPGIGEVVGISKEVRRAFSRRRVAIESSMAEHGSHSARGAQVAALDSRPDKPRPVAETDLRAEWVHRATGIGFRLAAVPQRRTAEVLPGDGALGRLLTERDATFDRRQVMRAVAEAATQGLAYEQIRTRSEEFLQSQEVVGVTPGRWTTPEMLALEADSLMSREKPYGRRPAIRGVPSLASRARTASIRSDVFFDSSRSIAERIPISNSLTQPSAVATVRSGSRPADSKASTSGAQPGPPPRERRSVL